MIGKSLALPEPSSHDTDSAEISTEPERYNRMDVFPIYTPIFIAYSSFSTFPFGTRKGRLITSDACISSSTQWFYSARLIGLKEAYPKSISSLLEKDEKFSIFGGRVESAKNIYIICSCVGATLLGTPLS